MTQGGHMIRKGQITMDGCRQIMGKGNMSSVNGDMKSMMDQCNRMMKPPTGRRARLEPEKATAYCHPRQQPFRTTYKHRGQAISRISRRGSILSFGLTSRWGGSTSRSQTHPQRGVCPLVPASLSNPRPRHGLHPKSPPDPQDQSDGNEK